MTKSSASRFRTIRSQHLGESAEDYTEIIADLITRRGEARTCDVARELGISHVTALKTLKRLKRDGYLENTSRAPLLLTTKGRRLARYSQYRHQILVEFLQKLGVPKNIAEVDAEGMEHHASTFTLKRFKYFLKSQK